MDVTLVGESVTLTPESKEEQRWLTFLITATLDGGEIRVRVDGCDDQETYYITKPAGKMK
jgi:hypothetical protein